MAWETRGTERKQFFYLSVRNDSGGVKKKFFGRGDQAQRAAEAVADRRNRREADRQAVFDAQAACSTADKLLAELDEAATALMEALLIVAGFHRHNYGPWRRKRNVQGRNQSAAHGGGPGRDQGGRGPGDER
jgi:hypothetical protein